MPDQSIQLKETVMRRVRFIYYMRMIFNPVVIEGTLFVGFATVLYFTVSIGDIIINTSNQQALFGYFSYLGQAFFHTRHIVQAATVFMAIGAVLVLKRASNNFKIFNMIKNPMQFFRPA
ncbi:hypothetical protein KGQ27_01480 [Patescibacteria group bacterium]|nr:hypothetical protein [Patescibacteria group bacterium]MDE1946487.1 hypothetical protein [Patescibacteria group bacterium]MDE2011161.1 hypothetical protein [Patescibacteria group bacterium]MDE2233543.1 hypothetical protein [Patescibacteria group bacterium]